MKGILIIAAVFLFLAGKTPLCSSQESEYQPLIAAMKEYESGNYQKALESYLKAEKVLPADPDVPFYLGLTYLQLGQTTKATEYFKKAVKINHAHLDARFQLGMVLIQEKEFGEAVSHLEKVFKQEPEKENLGYFLGYAYFNLGNYKKALSCFGKNKTSDKPIEQLNLYYSGLGKTYLGKAKEAEELYKQVIEIDFSSPLAQPSQQLLALKPVVSKAKRLNFELTTRFQYDDNLVLIPTTDVYNLRDKKRKTTIELFYLKGEYALLKTPASQISASYGFYQTIGNSLRDNDVQDHIVSLDWFCSDKSETFPRKNLRLTYSYDYLLSDYHSFLYRHTLRPVLIVQETSKNLTLFQYTYQDKNFQEIPLFGEDRRDAHNHESGLVHFLRFCQGKHFVKAGYFYDKELAEGSNWDYRGNKGVIGFQYTLPKDIRLSSDFEYKNLHYDNDNIYFDKRRKDIERNFTLRLSRDIGNENKTVSWEYSRAINSSNIALYDYEKNLVSIGLDWRW